MTKENSEDASDFMGNVNIGDIMKDLMELSNAASATECEFSGKRNRIGKKLKEHTEADRNWRGKSDEELKLKESKRGSKKY